MAPSSTARSAAPNDTADIKTSRKQRLFAGGVAPFYLAILAVTILVGISAVMVVSASSGEAVLREGGTLASFAEGANNLLFIFIGALLAAVISRLDYRRFASWSFPAAIAVLALLIYTLIWGATTLGAQRWIYIGSFSVQPSEVAKPVLLVFLAYVLTYFSEAREKAGFYDRRAMMVLAVPAALIGICLFLIILQPDLGTTSIIAFGLLIVYAMSGFGLRYLTLILPIAAALFIFRAFAQGNYQAQRIRSLLSGLFQGSYSHQVTQGLYALGSGGLFGAGLGLSRQKYYYLPEAQNDFILAVIGEEMGLLGTLMVVGAFALLMWAGFTITQGARDRMGRVLAAGATTMLITQALMNLLAVVGLGPVTGKPLPFVTLGGSAMISSFVLLGIILSVARFAGEPRSDYVEHRSLFTSFIQWWLAVTDSLVRDPEKKERRKRRTQREGPVGGDEDEGDLEWRWDSRSHLPSSRTGS